MAQKLNKLTARGVQALNESGRFSDGGGLYLIVDGKGETKAKRWLFIFRSPANGKQREMGLGSLANVSLADARAMAAEARRQLGEKKDPLEVRKAEAEKSDQEAVVVPTFSDFAETVITSLETGWRNEKHRDQWRSTIQTYCKPIARTLVDAITTEDVLSILQPIWTEKNETASRLRGRIEKVLDAAKAKGLRSGENPARWRGHLDHLLPKRQKLQRGHHPALAWNELPEFMAKLRAREGMAALALEFTILTTARTGESLGASWGEIDLDAKVWTVPAHRIKAGKEHRVALSSRAHAILEKLNAARSSAFVFPSAQEGKHLSEMALLMLLRRMDAGSVTVHGFRSTFRDWCGEATNFPREVAEAALAHAVGDAVERAYRRGDALEKRRALMEAWATYCEPKEGNVVPMVRPA